MWSYLGVFATAAAIIYGVRRLLTRGNWKPSGKGVWFRSLTVLGDADKTAETLKAWGVSWALLIGDAWGPQVNDYHPGKIEDYAAAMKRAGIQVFLWTFPEPDEPWFKELVPHYIRLARRIGAKAIVVNAEKPFYSQSKSGVAKRLVKSLQDGGLKVILSSYPVTSSHPQFPWGGFSEADGGIPMIYDMNNNAGPNLGERSVKSWSRMYGAKNVWPVVGMSSGKGQTIEEEMELAESIPLTGGAISAWDAYWLSKRSDRRAWWASWNPFGADIERWS